MILPNHPAVNIAPMVTEEYRRRTPEDVLEELREANSRMRDSRALQSAMRAYSLEEIGLLTKMKGGLLPRDRAIKQLKQMMEEDLKRSFQNFVGQHNTPLLQKQIERSTREIQEIYIEVFKNLGIIDPLKVIAVEQDAADPTLINIKIQGAPWERTP